MDQTILNWILGGIGGLLGFLLNTVWQAVKDLQSADKQLVEKMSQIEVLVAGDYAKREDVDRLGQTLFQKLDHISEQINRKADKP